MTAGQQQHELQRQALAADQQQEQERLLQQQHLQFQEQQATFFRLQNEYHQAPTPLREHELLMLQQTGQHTQEMFTQQRQHLLERHAQDQRRLQEWQWHEIQLLQIQAQQQHQEQVHQQPKLQQEQPLHGYHNAHVQNQQLQHNQQQHIQPPSILSIPETSQPSQGADNSLHQHYFASQQHSQIQDIQGGRTAQSQDDVAQAMDVDDEEQLLSIASTIATFRQHPTTTDSGSFSAWASGPASTYSNDDSDPDAVVVFDTNVLISHLNFLHLLIQKYGSEPQKNESALPTSTRKPYVIFVVPWVVVQELDGLKSSGGCRGGGEVDVADKARRAIRYLQDELGRPEQSRRLRGQKISEHIEKQEQNDDNILDCCRYFRQLYPNKQDTKINLFSNDRNLCVKALIHEFRTISWNKIPFELGPVSAAILGSGSVNRVEDDHMAIDSDQSSGAVESTRAIRTKSSKSGGEYRLEVNDREIQRIKTSSSKITATPDGMDPKLFELTTHIIKNLRRHLEFTVPDHLMAHYGQDWRKITNFDETRVKEEDAAYDCGRLSQPIMLLMRYWRNVFADLYGTPSQALAVRSRIDNVQAFVKKWSRVETFGLGKVYKKDLTVFLDDVDIILAGLTSKPVPRHAVNFASSPTMEGTALLTNDTVMNGYYDVRNRSRLINDWRARCAALHG